jgi:hypothetical protein
VSRLVTLIRLDAKNLFERIRDRETEYLTMFSLNRTRTHFAAVFRSRFKKVQIGDLKFLSDELIVALNDFYESVEKMEWYLSSTQDMPQTVDDRVHFFIKDLSKKYELLSLYLEGEQEVAKEDEESLLSDSTEDTTEGFEEFTLETPIEESFEEISDEVLNDLTSS